MGTYLLDFSGLEDEDVDVVTLLLLDFDVVIGLVETEKLDDTLLLDVVMVEGLLLVDRLLLVVVADEVEAEEDFVDEVDDSELGARQRLKDTESRVTLTFWTSLIWKTRTSYDPSQ